MRIVTARSGGELFVLNEPPSPSMGEGRDRGDERMAFIFCTPSLVLPRGRLCRNVILRR